MLKALKILLLNINSSKLLMLLLLSFSFNISYSNDIDMKKVEEYYAKIKEIKTETLQINWNNIWYTENDVKSSNAIMIDSIDFIKEKKNTMIASKSLEYYFKIWLLYQDTSKCNQTYKAFVNSETGTILFDYQISFVGTNINSIKNFRDYTPLNKLHEQCLIWLESVLKIGYVETKKQGLTPLPEGFKWVKIP